MKPEIKSSLKSFVIELVVYAGLVVGYFFLVLNFLGDWLHRLFESDRSFYAVMALALIVFQGIALELLTRFLFAFIKPRAEAE